MVVGVLIQAMRVARLEAFVLVVEDEVDHAGDSVRTIDRRSATGEHFDPLQKETGNRVQVGAVPSIGGAWCESLAIDQHEGALAAKVPQVDRRRAGRTVGCGDCLPRRDLRQVVEVILHPCDTAVSDIFHRDGGNLRRTIDVAVSDTRTRDNDFLNGRTCRRPPPFLLLPFLGMRRCEQ